MASGLSWSVLKCFSFIPKSGFYVTAIIELSHFLNHFQINVFDEFYDLEFTLGPSMLQNRLEELPFDPSCSSRFDTLATMGAYEIGMDYGTNSVIVRKDENLCEEEECQPRLF